jgi:hypothetical protein
MKENFLAPYEKHFNKEIEIILKELGQPEGLYENIVDTLNNSIREGIFPNQVINALRIALSIQEGNQNMAFVASMQSGKSGTIYFLCNHVLPAIGFIKDYQSILFVTSMRDTDLYEQNCRNLQKDYYDAFDKSLKSSKIKVMKMSDFFNHPNPHKVVNDYNVELVVRDEDQYGCGEDSSFQFAFFDELRNRISDIKLLAVSATPYDILDAQLKDDGVNVDVIEGFRPPEYYGITEMLEDGIIEDLPKDFRPLQSQGRGDEIEYDIHPKVFEYVEHLLSFDSGLGIIRESSTERATELRKLLKKDYKTQCEIIVIGSNKDCDFSINEGIREVSDLVNKRGRRVILIVVQALTAGKDLGRLKEKVRFGIEPRDKQLANGAQGITGRFCGYHNNRDFKLLASKSILEHYSKFEQDWEIFNDELWRNQLANKKVKSLTTQTKLCKVQEEGYYTPILKITTLNYEELLKEKGREELDFINDSGFHRLLDYFDDAFFNISSKGTRFNQKGVTVRIASTYNPKSNRVYKNWNCKVGDDFGNVFFKKKHYEYGLLISNIPVNDPRNTLGFFGVKIVVAGKREFRQQISSTINKSMYRDNDKA